jgi:hypothetical protein
MDYYIQEARVKKASYAGLEKREAVLKELGIKKMFYATYILRRFEGPRAPISIRRQFGPKTVWQDADWALDFDLATKDTKTLDRLVQSRPVAKSGIKSHLVQQLKGLEWNILDCEFRSFIPFLTELNAPYWTSDVIRFADGTRTTQELLRFLSEREMVPSGAPMLEFARYLVILASAGIIEFPEFAIPGRREVVSSSEESPK